jgi:hypothetical protein
VSLKITQEAFFAKSNSFLAIILQLPNQFNFSAPKVISWQTGVPKLDSSLVEVKVTLRLTASQSISLGVEPHLGLMTRYLVLSDSYGLVPFVGRPL